MRIRGVTLALALFSVVAAISAQTTQRQQQTAPSASIQGTVTKSGAGQGLRRARVTLRRVQQGAPGITAGGTLNSGQPIPGQAGANAAQVTTDDSGRYVFNGVDPGSYRISVERDGFIRQEYGQRTFNGSGTIITIAAGQRITNVDFQMVAAGTISGRVFDETGEPLAGVSVQAERYAYTNGKRELVVTQQASTNDLGEYRLYWMTPGEYYVSATPRRIPALNASAPGGRGGGRAGNGGVAAQVPNEESYAPTYFPGTVNPESAGPVTLPAAAEVRGIDFSLRPTATVTIRGRAIVPVSAAQPQQPAPAVPRNQGGRGGPAAREGSSQVNIILNRAGNGRFRGIGARGGARTSVNSDGTFEIQGVVPGTYNLVAFARDVSQQYSAQMRFEVGNADVNNLVINLRTSIDVQGRILLDGQPSQQFRVTQLRVNLVPSEDLPAIGNLNAQIAEDGTFVLKNISPLEYRVRLSGLPQGSYLQAGRIGSLDALAAPFAITDPQATLQLQLGFAAGQVQGTVVDGKGNPYIGALATLVPDKARQLRTDLYFSTPTDQYGHFTFNSVPPGTYRVFAWEDIPTGAYQDPVFIEKFEDRGKPIRVDPSGSLMSDVTVIPAGN
jgi:protocatechuate 3,4-dioxygenase beta subunit